MKNFFYYLNETFEIMRTDRVVVTLSLIPVIIGLTIYMFAGRWLVGSVITQGEILITQYISQDWASGFLYYLLVGVITVGLYFLVSWTFVLFIALIASPFNDFISERVEKVLNGEEPPALGNSFGRILSNFSRVVWNEIKKVTVILLLSMFAFILGWFPLLSPVSIILTALLLTFSFLDYSFARHYISVGKCLNFMRKNWLLSAVSGLLFQFLFMVPILNIVALPFCVVYFTLFYTKQNRSVAIE